MVGHGSFLLPFLGICCPLIGWPGLHMMLRIGCLWHSSYLHSSHARVIGAHLETREGKGRERRERGEKEEAREERDGGKGGERGEKNNNKKKTFYSMCEC